MYKCILGCDPGKTGAIAIYYPNHPNLIACYDMPLDAYGVDGNALAKIVKQFNPDVAFVEKVSSRPKQGVVSVFSFGEAYGTAKGVFGALDIPIKLVNFKAWKNEFELGKDKKESLELARILFPDSDHFKLAKHHNRAEAALIAMYGFKSQFDVKEK